MKKFLPLVLRIIVAIILIQTLRFKFTAHPDSVYIFTQVGMEPRGRIGIGIVELIAGILILIPRTTWLGAGLAAGVLVGAIFMYLTMLGIYVKGDGGYCSILLWSRSHSVWSSFGRLEVISRYFHSLSKR